MKLKRKIIVFLLSFTATLLVITSIKLYNYKAMYDNQVQITAEVQSNNNELRSELGKKANKIKELEKEIYELKNQ